MGSRVEPEGPPWTIHVCELFYCLVIKDLLTLEFHESPDLYLNCHRFPDDGFFSARLVHQWGASGAQLPNIETLVKLLSLGPTNSSPTLPTRKSWAKSASALTR